MKEIQKWNEFVADARHFYDVNFAGLSNCFEQEAKEHFFGTSQSVELGPHELLGPAVCIKEIDLLTASLDDVKSVSKDLTFDISPENSDSEDLSLTMFVGWFSVHFDGSPYNPSLVDVVCSNEPREGDSSLGSPHWRLLLYILQ